MTAAGFIRGRAAYYDGDVWRFTDTDALAPGWGGAERPCPACGETADVGGPDPCIGYRPGVVSACCGHGIGDAYEVTAGVV